jgi:hypothetical protein
LDAYLPDIAILHPRRCGGQRPSRRANHELEPRTETHGAFRAQEQAGRLLDTGSDVHLMLDERPGPGEGELRDPGARCEREAE